MWYSNLDGSVYKKFQLPLCPFLGCRRILLVIWPFKLIVQPQLFKDGARIRGSHPLILSMPPSKKKKNPHKYTQ